MHKGCPPEAPYLGERMKVHGVLKNGGAAIDATLIHAESAEPEEVSGAAVIESVSIQESAADHASFILASADGYRIKIAASAEITWTPPLQSLTAVKAGDWIAYKGKPDAAGVVVVTWAKLSPDIVSKSEQDLRWRTDFDRRAASASAQRGKTRKADETDLPKPPRPYNDAAMLARITEIGDKLVPAYQLALPDADPAKIHFRFRLVERKNLYGAMTMPSGIIFIPRHVVERMQNDSQLAAVLADGIAGALERQEYRMQSKHRAAGAVAWSGLVVPYAGWGMLAGGAIGEAEISVLEREQSDRVSLGLLHDAGYDIDQAPIAWWLLSSKDQRPITQIDLPRRAAYVYRMLGENWHNPDANGDVFKKP